MVNSEAVKIDLGMSNYDHSIDQGFEEALRSNPDAAYGSHNAWDFYGEVYFKDSKFHEDVYQYRDYQETISADSLGELMAAVNSKYGNK